MPAFYKIDKDRRLVLSTASGVFTLGDCLDHNRKLSADPEFDSSFSQLVDFTQVTKIDASPEDVRLLAQYSVFSPPSRRAFIMTTDLAFGMGRMYEIIREDQGDLGTQIFRTLEEALDWVLS